VSGGRRARAAWVWGAALVALATAARLAWVLTVRTVPVSDFAMYRESANYLSEFGHLDGGFIYMPGFVALLALVKDAGGDLLAQKLIGVFFGGLGAAGLFVITWKLVDGSERGGDGSHGGDEAAGDEAVGDEAVRDSRWRRICPCPYAAGATLIYALWPAGIAMSSVVGTDVPAAALLVAALALLVGLAPRRPWWAALAFGVAMGLAAWVRAVALPLSGLALGYWLARREPLRRAVLYSIVGVAATLVVLLPWGIHHLRQSGALYFTDDHGGITALIGANPNSEGTYTRALNRTFQDLTGKSVLDEPHHQIDRAAYGLAREWMRTEPRYTLGLAVFKAERLFDPEQRLLYWPIYRTGVLVGPRAAWFAAHHEAIADLADVFGLGVMGLALAGIGLGALRRRWRLLALLPFQLALVATYTVFFAEPRYRLPIEILAFPFVALALGELAGGMGALVRRSGPELRRRARVSIPAAALVVIWWLAWPRLLEAGRGWRARHRWAATEVALAGHTRLLLWRPEPPYPTVSPIHGAPSGLHLQAGDDGTARAAVRLGEGELAAGAYRLALRVAAESASPGRLSLGLGDAGAPVDLPPAGSTSPARSTSIDRAFAHPGGPLDFEIVFTGPPRASIWIDGARIDPT